MFKIGEKLILEQRFADEKETYKCMVVEITDSTFYIDYPVNKKNGRIAFLADGTQLRASYTDEEKGTFVFETEVLKKVKGNIPMIALNLPPEESFIKIQRREFVRIETSLDVAVHPINGEFLPFRTITEDLSAGGAALILKNNVKINGAQFVKLWIAIPSNSGEISYLLTKCKVVRIIERKNGLRMLSVQFIDLVPSDIQVIMRYIFEKQLEERKLGK